MSKTGPPPGWKKKPGLGCQASMPCDRDRGDAEKRLADGAGIDHAPRFLNRGAEHRVGRAADAAAPSAFAADDQRPTPSFSRVASGFSL